MDCFNDVAREELCHSHCCGCRYTDSAYMGGFIIQYLVKLKLLLESILIYKPSMPFRV